MVALLLSVVLIVLLCGATGHALTRLLGWAGNPIDRLFLGLAATNTVFTGCSLFLPITGTVALVTGLLLLAGAFAVDPALPQRAWDQLRQRARAWRSHKALVAACMLLGGFAWCAAMDKPTLYDAGLYYLQALRWTAEHPAIPGLANLHGRFGFDPNIFTFVAATSLQPLFSRPVYAIGLVLGLAVLFSLVRRIATAFTEGRGWSALGYMVLLYSAGLFLFPRLSSPAPDVAVFALVLHILLRCLEVRADDRRTHGLLVVLGVYAATVKLSGAPVVLAPAALWLRATWGKGLRPLWPLLAGCLVVAGPWVARNVILTGWVAYPVPFLDVFTIDWKVPVEKVIAERDRTTAWARRPGPDTLMAMREPLAVWGARWLRAQAVLDIMLIALAFTGTLAIMVLGALRRVPARVAWVAVATLGGLLLWGWGAPDPRFGLAFITLGAMLPLLLLPRGGRVAAALSIAVVVGLAYGMFVRQNYRVLLALQGLRADPLVPPPMPVRTPDGRDVHFTSFLIDGTLPCAVPALGDRCFDTALPCCPQPDTTIHLRGTTLAEGFRSDP